MVLHKLKYLEESLAMEGVRIRSFAALFNSLLQFKFYQFETFAKLKEKPEVNPYSRNWNNDRRPTVLLSRKCIIQTTAQKQTHLTGCPAKSFYDIGIL